MNFWLVIGEAFVKSSIAIGLAMGTAAWTRRKSPATAHLLWVVAFGAVLVLPLVARLTPRVTVVEFPTQKPTVEKMVVNPSVSLTQDPLDVVSPNLPQPEAAAPTNDKPAQPIPLTWILPGVWMAGVAAVVARYLAALHKLRRFHRNRTVPVRNQILDGAALPGELCQSTVDEPTTAMTWGVLRPIILLPQDADRWSEDRITAVLQHELAHVRRKDFASQLLAEVACALYWFNPFVWLGARAMRADAELAADDAVLRSGVKPSVYAQELLQIAADLGRRKQSLTRIGIPAMNHHPIEARLHSVLSTTARRRGVTVLETLLALGAASLAVPLLAMAHVGSEPRSDSDREVASARVKALCVATIMYSSDYDDKFPSARTTEGAANQIKPYVQKSPADVFKSPTPGGKFIFNTRFAGVAMIQISAPASTPLWYETLTDAHESPVVGYADGHTRVLAAEDMAEFAAELKQNPSAAPSPTHGIGGTPEYLEEHGVLGLTQLSAKQQDERNAAQMLDAKRRAEKSVGQAVASDEAQAMGLMHQKRKKLNYADQKAASLQDRKMAMLRQRSDEKLTRRLEATQKQLAVVVERLRRVEAALAAKRASEAKSQRSSGSSQRQLMDVTEMLRLQEELAERTKLIERLQSDSSQKAKLETQELTKRIADLQARFAALKSKQR